MNDYGTITVRGEVLRLTRRGRFIVDMLTVVGSVVGLWVLVVVVALCE